MRYVSYQDRKKVAAALASGTRNAHAFSSSPRPVPGRRGEQPEAVPRRPTRPGRPLEHPAQPGRGPNHTYTATVDNITVRSDGVHLTPAGGHLVEPMAHRRAASRQNPDTVGRLPAGAIPRWWCHLTRPLTCHTGVHGQARREGSVAAVAALAHCCWVTA